MKSKELKQDVQGLSWVCTGIIEDKILTDLMLRIRHQYYQNE